MSLLLVLTTIAQSLSVTKRRQMRTENRPLPGNPFLPSTKTLTLSFEISFCRCKLIMFLNLLSSSSMLARCVNGRSYDGHDFAFQHTGPFTNDSPFFSFFPSSLFPFFPFPLSLFLVASLPKLSRDRSFSFPPYLHPLSLSVLLYPFRDGGGQGGASSSSLWRVSFFFLSFLTFSD